MAGGGVREWIRIGGTVPRQGAGVKMEVVMGARVKVNLDAFSSTEMPPLTLQILARSMSGIYMGQCFIAHDNGLND
jgi:hypothetical protein